MENLIIENAEYFAVMGAYALVNIAASMYMNRVNNKL